MRLYPTKEKGKRAFVLWIAMISAFASAAQEPVHQFSVQEAVEYAAKNSAQVRNALIGIDVQRQTNREVTAAAYPQASASISGNHYPNVAVQSFPNFIAQATYGVLQQEGVKDGNGNAIVSPSDFGIVQAQFGTKYNASAGADLSQLLFDGQVFVGLQARKTAMDFAAKTAEVTQEQIKANIYKIYYQLLAGKRQVSTIDVNISRLEKLLNDTREIYNNGFAEKLDISKAEVSLANLRTEKLRVENQLHNAYLGLKILMGMPVRDELVLTDTLPDQMHVEEALDTRFNYQERVEYEQLQLNKRLNEFNIKRYQLSYLPTVSLSASYAQMAMRNKFDFFKAGEPWFPSSSIGVRISVPIFDGFAKDARIKNARLQLEQTNNNLKGLELTIDKEIAEARVNIKSAIATMQYQEKNMQLAEEVYNQTKLKYEQGLGSNLEITSAQGELTTAQNNYYAALYDAISARVDYLRSTGKL